ncbi:hypothetical protein GDO81_020603 [Engystomops pustulosus]|uniref:ubiquitinyl hydrolase 1 n=1 Tax=Engystomops pustulosus TaxID=76066 RepID=A0AAV6YXG4_ENGPU|nr:hypothetical protein GDO81_020603 [Engystomops pustulosus]
MEEEEGGGGGSEEAALLGQHRREKKELQAKIQSMKNSVPKNDKKRRKQLNEDVAKLESELEERHKLELLSLSQKQSTDTEEKKAALEKERDERIAEAEIENLSGARHVESQKLSLILSQRQLQIRHIPSDGHCMYRAIEHQLKERNNNVTLTSLRHQTADYMQSHADDFLPFLTNSTTGEMYTQGERDIYVLWFKLQHLES